jgi:ATP-dependent Lon protease
MMAESPGQFLAQGLRRFRILRWLSDKAPYRVQVEYPRSQGDRDSDDVKAYAMAVLQAVKELLPLNPLYSEELKQYIELQSQSAQPAGGFLRGLTTARGEQLQEILDTLPLQSRMQKGAGAAAQRDKQQREFFLREQLKAIQKELGIAKDDRTAEVDKFKERLKKLTLTEEAQKRIDDELDKLSMLETGSPEYAVTRNYLDWITLLPWGQHSKDKLDLKRARRCWTATTTAWRT